MKTPVKLEKEKYTVHANYSPESIEKKMLKFVTPSGDEFEVTADELASMLVGQVNSEVISAMFVESERVNVVEVTRQLRVRADRDIKEGEEIRLEYRHPYPIEFAIIENAMNLAKINMDVPMTTLTKEYIDSVKEQIKPEQEKFINRFYKFFKNLKPKKNK